MDFSTGLPKKLIINGLLIALLCSCSAVQATSMYKWVDEQGTVHYDQLPPSNRESEVIKPQSGSAKQTKTETNSDTENKKPEAEDAGLAEKAPLPDTPDKTSPDDEMSRIRNENCKRAKTNLGLYMGQDKVRQPDGSEIVLDDETRAQMMEQAQQAIDKYCQ